MNYRKEIDGLRALAVSAVVFYHGNIPYFSGGYIGVDIFFVISGYLISSIVIEDIENKEFSLINFYNRRIRRILPALFLVILVSNILAFILMTRSELAFYMKSSFSGIFFYSNFFFWKHVSYFASDSEFYPLLHLWSLSIEEQFYLIFPFFMIVAYKFNKKITIPFLFGVFFFSFFFSQWCSVNNYLAFNFYHTLTRAWEILAGVIVGYFLFYKKIKLDTSLREILSVLSIFGLLLCIFLFPNTGPVKSILLLLPIAFTVILILTLNDKCSLYKILSKSYFVTIGLMSFSIYLWHQPLFAFSKILLKENNIFISIILIIFTILLSFLSWFFVEKKFRDKNKIQNKSLYNFFAVVSFILIFYGLNFLHFNENTDEKIFAKQLLKNNIVQLIHFDDRKFTKNRIIYSDDSNHSIAIGSSRIMQINNDLQKNTITNFAVNGATIEDIITLTLMSLDKFDVKELFIGIDPWIVNKNHNPNKWKSLEKEFIKSIGQIKNNEKKNNLFENLKNETKFENIYEKYLEKFYTYLNINNYNKKPPNLKNSNKRMISRDGRLIFPSEENKFTPSIINYGMKNFEHSKYKFELFEEFIFFLKNNYDVKIRFVFTPIHLESYNMTIKKYPEYEKVEFDFKNLAKKNKIKTFGSYDLKKTKCTINEFFDDNHPNEYCMNKLIKSINLN